MSCVGNRDRLPFAVRVCLFDASISTLASTFLRESGNGDRHLIASEVRVERVQTGGGSLSLAFDEHGLKRLMPVDEASGAIQKHRCSRITLPRMSQTTDSCRSTISLPA